MKILISGYKGFVGRHLVNNLKYLHPGKYELLFLDHHHLNDEKKTDRLVSDCNIIVHLAGVNRMKNESDVYDLNIKITNALVRSIERTKFIGKLIYASSVQEKTSSFYGKSKFESRQIFIKNSKKIGYSFTGLIIPNVFGPFCRINYNSFISTLSYNVINNIEFKIDENKIIPLIYIDNLIEIIISQFHNESLHEFDLSEDISISTLEVKKIIESFNLDYIDKNIIPDLKNDFYRNLFNTFRSYVNLNDHFPVIYNPIKDNRGSFFEVIRTKHKGQFSFSTTLPGVERGHHFHTRKIERFTVIKGTALLKIRDINSKSITEFKLNGNQPSFIDIPIWNVHSIQNTGSEELITLFWINEFYDPNDSDTYQEKV